MKVDFEGMPVMTLLKLAFNELKVKGRPAMKKLDLETLKDTYDGQTIKWNVLLDKNMAASHARLVSMSDAELEKKILEIQKRRELSHLTEEDPKPYAE